MAQQKPTNITSSDDRALSGVIVPKSGNKDVEREHQNRINKHFDDRIEDLEDVIDSAVINAGSGDSNHTTLTADPTNFILTDSGDRNYHIDIATGGIGSTELASTAVTAGDYGSDDQSPTFTVDADGRLTAAADVQIPITVYLTAAENLSAGDFIGVDSSGEAIKAIATGFSTKAIGYVKSAFSAAATAKVYLNKGPLTGLSGLTIGNQYYLSSSTAGGVSSTPTLTEGYIVQTLGTAVSTTSLEASVGVAREVYTPTTAWTFDDLDPAPYARYDETTTLDEHVSESGTVGEWYDKALGSARSLKDRAGLSNSPQIIASGIGGLRSVRFDGSNDHLSDNGTTPLKAWGNNADKLWAFIVYDKTSADASDTTRILFSTSVGTGSNVRFAVYAGLGTTGNKNKPCTVCRRADADSGALVVSSGGARTDAVMVLATADYANDDLRLWVDDVDVGNATISGTSGANTSSTDALYLPSMGGHTPDFGGGSSYCDADVSVLIIGRGNIPDTAERNRLFGYAAWHFGLEGNLDPGHPYASAPPTV